MRIIALSNQKGGVAKTTSTYNLACAKAEEGKKVLMIDLDPQASLTISCGIEPGTKEFTTSTLFKEKTDPTDCCYSVKASGLDNLYLVPADIDLAETESSLFVKTSREKRLKRAVRQLEEYFDIVFIDCPPQLGLLLTNALVASDEVIIPVKTDYLSYRGLRALLATIKNVQQDSDLNSNLKVDGFIATMHEKNVKDQQDVLTLLGEQGEILGIVKKSADTYRTVIDGLPVILSNRKSDVAVAYKKISKKI